MEKEFQTDAPSVSRSDIFLANAIGGFHILVVLFVVFAPFTNIAGILVLHFTFCITLLVHWWAGSNACSLSIIESKLRGLETTQTMAHKFIAPVYDISATEWSRICHIVVYVVIAVSAYKLYNSGALSDCMACFRQTREAFRSEPGTQFITRFRAYIRCFMPMFEIRSI